jgi:hypothetical protein
MALPAIPSVTLDPTELAYDDFLTMLFGRQLIIARTSRLRSTGES